MGLDVGVIPTPIQYLERPDQPVYDFLWHLSSCADDGNWNVFSEGNTIIEYMRENMDRQMEEYIRAQNLSQEAKDNIRGWVDALPWEGNHIMLHFSW